MALPSESVGWLHSHVARSMGERATSSWSQHVWSAHWPSASCIPCGPACSASTTIAASLGYRSLGFAGHKLAASLGFAIHELAASLGFAGLELHCIALKSGYPIISFSFFHYSSPCYCW